MVDPTASQATAKQREIKEGLLRLCCDTSRTRFKEGKFLDAIYFEKLALLHCHELGKEKEAQNRHRRLFLYYISQSKHILQQVGDSEEALENAKLALEHSKEVDDEKFRRPACESLALLFLKLQDFGEALINGEEWLSYFKENDDTEEKHDAQWTMTSSYYKRALNSLNNKQFKEASDDGEQALVYYKDDKSLTIKIRWLLVRAYFLQEDFKNALEQFDEPDMLSLKLDVEDYIKAGKIHQKMRRYDEAISYFEKAKKDTNSKLKKKVNKWIKLIQEAKIDTGG